ncbi:uncharacterized protein LOC111832137 [Capsella rubella]|uniref:uncharacterized protein LOC111832137 n=1 Tax=Capsella rubella TaxID=81985 RepID=UPI000CD5314C|nr:uncharacterized protein LOC111832137 [Capsella rubella]
MEEWCQQQGNRDNEFWVGGRVLLATGKLWIHPPYGTLKCNIHSSWINESSFSGGAWVLRNHEGDVMLHARDAFRPCYNLWLDCKAAWEAITNPVSWPKYRASLSKIGQVIRVMRKVSFHLSSPKANLLAREIGCSVTRDGRLTSHLALGGPSWLHDRIERDKRRGV